MCPIINFFAPDPQYEFSHNVLLIISLILASKHVNRKWETSCLCL